MKFLVSKLLILTFIIFHFAFAAKVKYVACLGFEGDLTESQKSLFTDKLNYVLNKIPGFKVIDRLSLKTLKC